MSIRVFQYQPTGLPRAAPSLVGFDIEYTSEKQPVIHLFDLRENKGAPVHEQLWPIAVQLCQNFTPGIAPTGALWTITQGARSGCMLFSALYHTFYRVDTSNKNALSPPESNPLFSIEDYELDRHGLLWKAGSSNNILIFPSVMDGPDPASFFAAPSSCVPGGSFYLQPPYFETALHDQFDYILADTQKLAWRAGYQIKNDREPDSALARAWIAANRLKTPAQTGILHFSGKKARLSGIDPSTMGVFQDLGLPFIPIAVSRAFQASALAQSLVYRSPTNDTADTKPRGIVTSVGSLCP